MKISIIEYFTQNPASLTVMFTILDHPKLGLIKI